MYVIAIRMVALKTKENILWATADLSFTGQGSFNDRFFQAERMCRSALGFGTKPRPGH
jgi:hypothetical protein